MNYEEMRRIQKVFFNLGSFSRDLYRSVVREKPELDLPSERQINKEFGSFRAFADKIRKKEVKKTVVKNSFFNVNINYFKNFTEKMKLTKKNTEPKKEDVVEVKIDLKDVGLFEQSEDWNGKIGIEEVEILKELIKEKRLELFKNKLESYHWDPESRKSMFW